MRYDGWVRSPFRTRITTINDTNTQQTAPLTDEERQRSFLAGRTADGSLADTPAPLPNGASAPAGGGTPMPNTITIGPSPGQARPQGLLQRWKEKGGLLGTLASFLLLLAKIGLPILSLLGKFKFLLGAGSMLVSMWAWGLVYGWRLGVGIVLLIFIHECGHALAARMRGIPTGIMVFVPFMGAFVTTGRYGKSIVEDAFIGIMGPVFGTLSGLGCLLLYLVAPNPYWLVLAQFCFLMNLFNLAPTPPLDGGWITPLFSPKLLAIGAVLLLFIAFYNPLVILLALMSLPRIIAGWKAKPEDSPYYQATTADRWRYGLVYLGLDAFLALAGYTTHSYLTLHIHPIA